MFKSGRLRVIYFPSEGIQEEYYTRILKLQGFDTPLEQYEIAHNKDQSILQSGGFTSIRLAKHKVVGKTVAIKVIDKLSKGR